VSELSQDVFDELLRRQALSGGPRGVPPPNHNIPPYLPPRPEFHDKRNQARQKLSSLQFQRFKDLAADVLCELERRYPNFSIADNPARGRRQSPALSAASGFSNGRSSNGTGTGTFPPRSTSRARPPPLAPNGAYAGEPGPHAHGYPGQSPSVGRFPPRRSSSSRNGSSHGPPPNGLGIMQSPGLPAGQGPPMMGAGMQGDSEFAPMAKSSQSNTIVPVKSTLVEEDSVDDEAETEVQEQQGDTARASHVSAASKDHRASHDRTSQPQNTDRQAAKAEEGSQSTAQVAELTALVEHLKAEIAVSSDIPRDYVTKS
ncbi:component of the polarisome, partial [Ascosphaera atra]